MDKLHDTMVHHKHQGKNCFRIQFHLVAWVLLLKVGTQHRLERGGSVCVQENNKRGGGGVMEELTCYFFSCYTSPYK